MLIKETAIVGYVGLMDIQKAGDFIKSATFIAFMPLIGTAVIYYVLIKILTLALRQWRCVCGGRMPDDNAKSISKEALIKSALP